MKYELENRDKAGLTSQAFGVLKRGPDVRAAAKSGEPAMTSLRPTIPVSVPVPADAGAGFSGDVTATTVQDSTTLDTQAGRSWTADRQQASEARTAAQAPVHGTRTDVTGTVVQRTGAAADGPASNGSDQRSYAANKTTAEQQEG